ncbi:aminotransferase class V-fold PLP-dependent enzyme, partial [bacterium]|nr:aminotransferase class V-fold PLP-dependent enzyme [bacterium]
RNYRLTHNIGQMILNEKMGVDVTLMISDDVKNLHKFLTDRTKVLTLDVPSNPMMTVYDLEQAVKIAHERGIIVVLDETCATPFNLRALEMGVDVIACSLTKYMCGHGNAIGGYSL